MKTWIYPYATYNYNRKYIWLQSWGVPLISCCSNRVNLNEIWARFEREVFDLIVLPEEGSLLRVLPLKIGDKISVITSYFFHKPSLLTADEM